MSSAAVVAPLSTTPVAQAIQDYAAMNKIMAKVCPELAPEHAQFPVSAARWYHPSEKTPNGQPCFLPGLKNNPMIMDYVSSSMAPLVLAFTTCLPHFMAVCTTEKLRQSWPFGSLLPGKIDVNTSGPRKSFVEVSRRNIAAGPQTARSDVLGLRKHGLTEQAKIAVPVPGGSVARASDNINSVC